MNYETWRATYQSSEQAAKAAFQDAQRNHRMLVNALTRCNELDANLQRIIEAATVEGPGVLTQAAIEEMPAHSLAQRDAEKQAEAVTKFAKEVWEELFKRYRNVKVFPLTMAKAWCERRNEAAIGIKPETMPSQPAVTAGTLGGHHAAS
ncbi:hypothetical protein [Vreelandella populi]|uniref:hypothetical protein n=1 Tax=Vreelandella populi TaxID=2498858 RepID=UPI000F8E1F07|nr:hypothetical protein [Halomonas populi]RUR51388.1 hypothetical protein ELY40_16435 [Halomonas populi]